MSKWRLDGFLWRDRNSGDSGDVIYNTMTRIIDMEVRDQWAHYSFEYCCTLLRHNKRWPDRLNQENTAKNRIQWWLSDRYTRPQDDMTRDPYIACICCAMHLGRPEDIEDIRIPWYLYHRKTWRWRKKLIKDDRELWKKRLSYYRALAVVIKNSDDPNIIANKLEI